MTQKQLRLGAFMRPVSIHTAAWRYPGGTPSATTSRCPYKGPASYWSVKISGEAFSDLVWGYMEPIAEIPKIKGLLCFFHERGCDIYVDGELMPTPQTKWAHPLRT